MSYTGDNIKLMKRLRTALRLSSTSFDADELVPLVDACRTDLSISGVKNTDPDNPLVLQAIILYCKSHFGFNPDSDKFEKAYSALKNSMALSSDLSIKDGVS